MKRGVLTTLLATSCLVLGVGTLAICSKNCARAERLDSLHRSCQDLILRNAHSRAKVAGHQPGNLDLEGVEVSE